MSSKIIIPILLIALTLHASDPEAWREDYQTALGAIRDKNYTLSILLLQKILNSKESISFNEGVYYHLGISYFGLGQYKESLDSFLKAKKAGSESTFTVRSTYWAAESYFKLKEFNRSAAFIREYLTQNIKDEYAVKAYLLLGNSLHELGMEEDEIAALGEGVEKLPNHEQTPYLHRKLGQTLFEKKRYKEAISVFSDIILNSKMNTYSKANLHFDAEIYIGRSYAEMGNLQQAKRQFNLLLGKFPDENHKPIAYYFLGMALFNNKEESNGLKEWEFLRNHFPNSSWTYESYFSEADYLKERKKYEAAAICLEKLLKNENTPVVKKEDAFAELSNLYLKLGKSSLAADTLQKLSKSTDAYRKCYANFNLGEILSTTDSKKSLEYYKSAVSLCEDSKLHSASQYGYLSTLVSMGKVEEAEGKTKEILKKMTQGSYFEKFSLLVAEIDLRLSNIQQGMERANLMLKSQNKEIRDRSLLIIGTGYFLKKMFARSDTEFAKLHKTATDKQVAISSLIGSGNCRMNLRQYDKAKEVFGTALYEYADSIQWKDKEESLYKIALIDFRLGNFIESVRAVNELIQSKPKFILQYQLYNLLGMIHSSTGKFQDALVAFQNALNTIGKEGKGEIYYRRGLIYLKNGKKKEAVSDFLSSRETGEEHADDSHFEIFRIFAQSGDEKKMVESLKIFRKQFPESSYFLESLYMLQDFFRKKNNSTEEKKIQLEIEEVVLRSVKTEEALFSLAEKMRHLGKFSKMEEYCIKFLKIYGESIKSDDCVFMIAQAKEKLKSQQEKLSYLLKNKHLVHENRKWEYLLLISESYIKSGNNSRAEAILKSIPDEDPVKWEKYYQIGWIADRKKDTKTATQYYKKLESGPESEKQAFAILRLARFEIKEKLFETAVIKLSKILYNHSAYYEKYSEALYFMGYCMEKLNRTKDRDFYLNKLSKEAPGSYYFNKKLPASDNEVPYN